MVQEKRQQAKSRFAALAASEDWLVLDTETTGLERKDELVSIAVVSAAGETVLHELIRPTQPISPQAARVHGITAEDVAAASPFPDLYPRLAELLTGRLVLAYNANFDWKMLQQTCQKYRLPMIQAEWECVMELYAAAKGRWSSRHGFTWCKLAEACQREDIAAADFHEACADAQATQQLVMAVGNKK